MQTVHAERLCSMCVPARIVWERRGLQEAHGTAQWKSVQKAHRSIVG